MLKNKESIEVFIINKKEQANSCTLHLQIENRRENPVVILDI